MGPRSDLAEADMKRLPTFPGLARVARVGSALVLSMVLVPPPAQAVVAGGLVLDINPTGSSNPQNIVGVGNLVYFSADDGTHGRELWRSDGTAAGTWLVADINSGPGDSDPSQVCDAADVLFFTADDGVHGRELWRTDGNASGTAMVKDISKGSGNTGIEDMTAVGTKLFFVANEKLWVSDGTSAGTIALTSPLGYTDQLVSFGGKLYFLVNGALWRSDGTVTGTKLLKWSPKSVDELAAGSNYLFMLRGFDFTGPLPALWRTDGTRAGLLRLATVDQLGQPGPMVAAGNRTFFSAYAGAGSWRIWKSNGTVAGTKRLVNLGNTDRGGGLMGEVIAAGTRAYFTIATQEHPELQLWKSDGKPTNTTLLTYLPTIQDPGEWTPVGNTLCFYTADYSTDTWAIWETDGTVAGTYASTTENGADHHPTSMAGTGGRLYYDADDGVNGRELWSYMP
jgi:ELWxxDGT repeat protein